MVYQAAAAGGGTAHVRYGSSQLLLEGLVVSRLCRWGAIPASVRACPGPSSGHLSFLPGFEAVCGEAVSAACLHGCMIILLNVGAVAKQQLQIPRGNSSGRCLPSTPAGQPTAPRQAPLGPPRYNSTPRMLASLKSRCMWVPRRSFRRAPPPWSTDDVCC